MNGEMGGFDGWTALHLAAKSGDRDIVNLLLDSGVDLNPARNNSSWGCGSTSGW